MAAKHQLIDDFYNLKVHQLMDKRVWDLPLIEAKEGLKYVLSILGGRNHIWVINNKEEKKLLGIITEHDVLSILAPKNMPSYVFGMPDILSIQHGTVKTAKDIMCSKTIITTPDEKIIDALMKMVKYKLRRLPVINEDKIVGELTLHQLIRKYYSATQYHPLVDQDEEG
jgi:predicted transcriptional regulator